MKLRQKIIIILVTASLAVFGCSDDDCATCPEGKQEASMFAIASLGDAQIQLMGYIFSIDGTEPALDSVTLGGWPVEIVYTYSYFIGNSLRLNRDAGSYRTGDSIELKIYTPKGLCSSKIRLLDVHWDEPTILNHAVEYPYDTVGIGEDIVVNWAASPTADWFAVNVVYECDSSGVHLERSDFHALTEPPFTISGSDLPYNGYVEMNVMAMTGAAPTTVGGNVTGVTIKGTFNSYAFSEQFKVYVGNGNAGISPAPESSPLSTEDILKLLIE